jgi:hypothetical protein
MAQAVPAPTPKAKPAAGGLYVASPRKDSRRKGGVTYKPWTGKALKPGQYLAVKEGKKYRRATDQETAAA